MASGGEAASRRAYSCFKASLMIVKGRTSYAPIKHGRLASRPLKVSYGDAAFVVKNEAKARPMSALPS
jgi:hypothetical protein